MNRRLFVGNLAYSVTEPQLTQLFTGFGTVVSATILMDRDTGRSRGFGFVEMATEGQAQEAIAQLHEADYAGRRLIVGEARAEQRSNGNKREFRGGNRGGGKREARW